MFETITSTWLFLDVLPELLLDNVFSTWFDLSELVGLYELNFRLILLELFVAFFLIKFPNLINVPVIWVLFSADISFWLIIDIILLILSNILLFIPANSSTSSL